MKQTLSRVLGLIGVNPFALLALRFFPKYLVDRRKFKHLGGTLGPAFPVLIDYTDQAGTMSGHYYHQDLLVAQLVFENNPSRHIDVGSRIDGFVAHVASFREIQIADIRPIVSKSKNITFIQADLMKGSLPLEKVDSLSCLHTLEHFGLGRYGDDIDPEGHLKGFKNLISMLEVGGIFYLSFPISSRERVEFNAHRVFHPTSVLGWDGVQDLHLMSFHYIDDSGSLFPDVPIEAAVSADLQYGCGVYVFKKK